MSIQKDSVVTFNYTLKDDAGELIDQSEKGHPLAYLHGHGNLVPGLERELEGKTAGVATQSPSGAELDASAAHGRCCRHGRHHHR